MRPALDQIRKASEEIRFALSASSLGTVLVAAGDKGILAILVDDDPRDLVAELQQLYPASPLFPNGREEKAWASQISAFIDSPSIKLDLPLDLRGTTFQKRVWTAVRAIPLGQTRTYSDIARKIGAPRAMRAVGTACAHCRHSLAIPCHRVLRSDGTFSGSPDWTERQAILMAREVAAISSKPDRSRAARRPAK